MVCSEKQQFMRELGRHRTRRKIGLTVGVLIRVAGIFCLALAIYGALDYFLALQPKTRIVFDVSIGFALLGLLVSWLLDVLRVGSRDMAIHLDEATADPRRDLLSACELSCGEEESHDDLSGYLRGQAIHQSIARLKTLTSSHVLPWPELRVVSRTFGLHLLIALFIICLDMGALSTIGQRILFPQRDIPPYSPYVFVLEPASPHVLYGGNLELTVDIRGADVRDQVWCWTRSDGNVTRSACFQENRSRFVQRLERITVPVEFCFATGKARSKWESVRLDYQPEIAAVSALVTPPPYTGLAAREFLVGSEPLDLLPGSQIEMRVTSNRDLVRGELSIRPDRSPANVILVDGEPGIAGTMKFAWVATHAGTLSVHVFDLAGTANREPLVLKQTLATDEPPEPVLDKPPVHSLATVGSILPIRGYVSDDHGLRYVGLTCGLVGYRDRFKTLPGVGGNKRYDVRHELDLNTIGVRPGDVLEFYIEAGDRNPALSGVAASDLARVEIISEDEYAAMLRERTTLRAFLARFKEAQKNMDALRKAVAALQETLNAKNSDPDTVKQQLDQLREQHRKSQDIFLRLAVDFTIYDIEEQLKERLGEISQVVDKQSVWLDDIAPESPALPGHLARMANDLSPLSEGLDEDMADAVDITAIVRVMQQAQRFKRLLQQQQELVRRMERYRSQALGSGQSLLPAMQRRQAEIREQLDAFGPELIKLAHELPPDQIQLEQDAIAFAAALQEADITGYMNRSEAAAENQNGRDAWQAANVALEKMNALLAGDEEEGDEEGNSFAGLCNGNGGSGSRESLAKTLAQMLESLCSKPGRGRGYGTGSGAGGGGDGDKNDGYWGEGQSPLNVPVFGPQRGDYGDRNRGGKGHAGKAGAGMGKHRMGSQSREAMQSEQQGSADSKSMLIEEIPEKYRDAIKEYFSE